jgi:hypothetical protein
MHRLRTGLLVVLTFAPIFGVGILVSDGGALTVIGAILLSAMLWPFVADLRGPKR